MMNVRNLKQLFQQKGTIKPAESGLQGSSKTIRPKLAQQQQIKKTAEEMIILNEPTSNNVAPNQNFMQELNKQLDRKINNNTEANTKGNKGQNYIEPAPNHSRISKNFLQQLNKKLDNKNVNTATRTGGISYIGSAPNNTVNKNLFEELNQKLDKKSNNNLEVPTGGLTIHSGSRNNEKEKNQCQITMQDIITGVDIRKQKNESLKVRYGINESNPRRTNQKQIFGGLNSMEVQNDTNSFSDLLQKMLRNMNIGNKQDKETVNQEPRKSKIVNKYQYGEQKLTQQQKLKRINFVLNIAFGISEFQHVSSKKQIPNRNTAVFGMNPKVHSEIILQKQQPQDPKLITSELLVQNKNSFQNVEALPQRMKSGNNLFLNELSLKIQKKQNVNKSLQAISQQKQELEMIKDTKIDSSSSAQVENLDGPLTPRQRKKQKNIQNFDDL